MIPGANVGQSQPLSLNVLVVDDDDEVLAVAGGAFEAAGHRVFRAPGGQEALAILDAHPEITLLFTDIVMPGPIDGFDLAERAKRQRPGLHVIFTSGYLRGEGLWDAPLLRKPWTADDLRHAIADVHEMGRHKTAAPPKEVLAGPILGETYRREAKRLLGLAASTAFEEAKATYIELARRYEELAVHAESLQKSP